MLLKLFKFFLNLGFIGIGGGYPMMGIIMTKGAEVGLTAEEFADLAALELLASGPIIINAATYIGYIKGGFLGAVVSTIGLISPAFIFVTAVIYFLSLFKDNPYWQAFIDAIKVSCGGILLVTAITLGETILLIEGDIKTISYGGIVLFIAAMIALLKFKLDPIKLILGSAVVGMFIF